MPVSAAVSPAFSSDNSLCSAQELSLLEHLIHLLAFKLSLAPRCLLNSYSSTDAQLQSSLSLSALPPPAALVTLLSAWTKVFYCCCFPALLSHHVIVLSMNWEQFD